MDSHEENTLVMCVLAMIAMGFSLVDAMHFFPASSVTKSSKKPKRHWSNHPCQWPR